MQGVMQVWVLGVNVFQRRDGTHAARIFVASTPLRVTNVRGLVPVEFDALPEVADAMKVLPGLYKLDLDLPVATGLRNELRPLVVGASLVAPLVPEKKVQQGA